MSSETSIDIREVIFVNQAAEEAYRGLPDEVRQAADARTTAIQNNQLLQRNQRQSLSGKFAGIDEVRILFEGDPIECTTSWNLWRWSTFSMPV
jgi:hypothetical protein